MLDGGDNVVTGGVVSIKLFNSMCTNGQIDAVGSSVWILGGSVKGKFGDGLVRKRASKGADTGCLQGGAAVL